ncbi:hypothetical protein [Sorangium sp. So ce388]|uniref:hypothetical protein n=1 Tax=Sorangium sp. So ce388 TaxID=3133309 RepID=UPI003F5B1A92
MSSPDFGAEAMARLEDADRKRAERAIRSVREYLTRAYDPREDMGVLETLRPLHIARLLAGHMDVGGDLFELMWAHEHFVELGRKIVPFHDEFLQVREEAKRGKKRYLAADEELRAAFGDDWRVVRDAWPAVPFLVQVLALRANPSMSEQDRITREEGYWIEAEVFLTLLHPSQPAQPDVKAFVERIISTMNRKGDDLLVQEVLHYVLEDAEGLRKRLLAYRPTGEDNRALHVWVAAFKNAARDLRARSEGPKLLGVVGDRELKRAPGTLRRWKHEENKRAQAGEPRRQGRPVDIAIENDARRAHKDPTGMFLTLTEVAKKLRVAESSARSAVKRAVKAGALVTHRQRSSRSYAFRSDDVRIIKNFLGARRAPKGGGEHTIESAAREAGMPVDRAIDLINAIAVVEDLDGTSERMVRPRTPLPQERYDLLVEVLREHQQSAATSGSAKPRTS